MPSFNFTSHASEVKAAKDAAITKALEMIGLQAEGYAKENITRANTTLQIWRVVQLEDIKNQLNKTCTIIDSKGAIAGENNTLICYVSYFELPVMKDIISEHKGSFSTVSTIDEIVR